MRMKSKLGMARHGFTLIELLVIIAIMPILAVLLLPALDDPYIYQGCRYPNWK